MEMLRRNLKRQPSRSLSAFAVSSPLPADGQENLHPNLTATPPPMSPAKNSLASPRSKPVPASAAAAVPPPEAAAVEEERAVPARAPADNEPSVKVVVRVRPAVSRPVDGKDLFFVRKTSPSSVAVGDRAFAVDGFLDDRASQEDAFHLVGVPMIDSTLAGFNTSLVCYGQSGTGKTYTMWGPLAAMFDSRSNRADRGIVPRFFQHLFSQIQGKQESSPEKQTSYQCRCSFLEACVLPPPRKSSCANYARVVNNILQGLTNMQLWLRIPLEKSEPMDEDPARVNNNNNATTGTVDSWEWWNSFRLLCEHSSQLYVALDILSSLPSMNSLGRWFREPVRAAILQTNAFLTNARGYPCLSKRHQTLLSGFFNHSVQIIISRRSNHNVSQVSEGVLGSDENHTEDTLTRHALSPYLDYIAYLYQRMDPLPEQERFEINYRDFLQSPLQPLMDNLEAQTYETFEKGTVKYKQDCPFVHMLYDYVLEDT